MKSFFQGFNVNSVLLLVAIVLLADATRNIADIIAEEHARCQAEKARTGRQ